VLEAAATAEVAAVVEEVPAALADFALMRAEVKAAVVAGSAAAAFDAAPAAVAEIGLM